MPLAGDVGCTGIVLGVERVKILIEPFVRGFARIDRTSDPWPGHQGADLLSPKNRGPDHLAPVMARAIADKDEWR